jgi:hypothetical protein
MTAGRSAVVVASPRPMVRPTIMMWSSHALKTEGIE